MSITVRRAVTADSGGPSWHWVGQPTNKAGVARRREGRRAYKGRLEAPSGLRMVDGRVPQMRVWLPGLSRTSTNGNIVRPECQPSDASQDRRRLERA
jgi:hypothetical protein